MSTIGTASGTGTERWIRVASLAELPPGEMLAVAVDDHEVALYRLGEDEVRATANVCTHALAYLTDGWLEDGEIECPLHGGRFDVRSGRGLCAPIESDLRVYPVRIEGEDILIGLCDEA